MVMKIYLALASLLVVGSAGYLSWYELLGSPGALEEEFLAGTRALEEGRPVEAVSSLRLALPTPDSTLRMAAHHNLALAYLEMSLGGWGRQALEWARASAAHGRKALALSPGLRDTAWNLELALRRSRELEEEVDRRAGDAWRLLSPFRLQEEASLRQALREELMTSGGILPAVKGGGPAW